MVVSNYKQEIKTKKMENRITKSPNTIILVLMVLFIGQQATAQIDSCTAASAKDTLHILNVKFGGNYQCERVATEALANDMLAGAIDDAYATPYGFDVVKIHDITKDDFPMELHDEWDAVVANIGTKGFPNVIKDSYWGEEERLEIVRWLLWHCVQIDAPGMIFNVPVHNDDDDGRIGWGPGYYDKSKWQNLKPLFIENNVSKYTDIPNVTVQFLFSSNDWGVGWVDSGEYMDQTVEQGTSPEFVQNTVNVTGVHEIIGHWAMHLGHSDGVMKTGASWGNVQNLKTATGEVLPPEENTKVRARLMEDEMVQLDELTGLAVTMDTARTMQWTAVVDTITVGQDALILDVQDLFSFARLCDGSEVLIDPEQVSYTLSTDAPLTLSQQGSTISILDQGMAGAGTLSITASYPTDEVSGATASTTLNYAVYIQQSTAIQEIDGRSTSVYPNPASTSITIISDAYDSYQLMNIHGNSISQGSISGRTRVDLSNIPTGIYIVLFYDKTTGHVAQTRVIKK